MRVTFELLGRCRTSRSVCAHLDGDFKKSPCNKCERNPRLTELRDQFVTQATIEKRVDKAIDAGPEAQGEKDPDHAREDANDGVLGEFGVKPAASRRAARDKRPDVA